MKKYLSVAFLLPLGVWTANAETIDLNPDTLTGTTKVAGISAADVWTKTAFTWFGTWERDALANQVSVNTSEAVNQLSVQIGNVASENTGGNYAAVKFTAEDPLASISFDVTKNSQWGAGINNFSCLYSCNVYGFDETGNATEIGSWELAFNNAGTIANGTAYTDQLIVIDALDDYSAYALIFSVLKTHASAGGMGVLISNITATTIPESSAFGLLAGLGIMALVGTRRRRK